MFANRSCGVLRREPRLRIQWAPYGVPGCIGATANVNLRLVAATQHISGHARRVCRCVIRVVINADAMRQRFLEHTPVATFVRIRLQRVT